MLEITCIEDEQSFRSLAADWNELLQSSRSDGICLTWEWIFGWWEVFGKDYDLLVLVAREGGKVRGLAPLMVSRGEGAFGGLFRHLMFIGQGKDVTSEYVDFIIEPEREDEITAAFCDFLSTKKKWAWDFLSFEMVLKDSPNRPQMIDSFSRRGVDVQELRETECPYAELPDSWDAFLQTKSKHFRKRTGYNQRRLARDGEIKYLVAGEDIELDKAFDEMVRLNRERWGQEGGSFRSDGYVRFHRTLCHRLQEKGWLLLALMTVGDRVAAAKYDFCYAGKYWGNQGGWLKELEKKEVGNVFIGWLIERGIAQGFKEYDFLGGEDQYKRRWGHKVRNMVDLEAYSPTVRGRAFALGMQGKGWLRERIDPETYRKLGDWKKSIGL